MSNESFVALEQIMNQLMENGHKPVPLPEKEIDDLPRAAISDDSEPHRAIDILHSDPLQIRTSGKTVKYVRIRSKYRNQTTSRKKLEC